MAEEIGDRLISDPNTLLHGVGESAHHGVGDGIDRAAAERIVRVRLQQRFPRGDHEGQS